MKNEISVLLVTYEFPPHMNIGGIGSCMFNLALLLGSAGYRVTVFSASTSSESVQKIIHPCFTNYLFLAPNVNVFRDSVRNFFHHYIKDNSVDLIESPEVGACAIGIKEDYPDIPMVVRLHTPGVMIARISNTYQPVFAKLRFIAGAIRRGRLDLGYWSKTDKNKADDPEYRICLLANKLVSPSKALADYLIRFWQLKKEINIIPNPFYPENTGFRYPIEGREKVICFIGKLTILKGMFSLTPALKKILKAYQDYRVVLAGRDEPVSPEIPSMRCWMEKELSDVIDRIHFVGVLKGEQVIDLLGKSRICVIPSLWENYPTVILEAMAAGAAVVAADRGGIPELVARNKTGYLFNPLNPNSICRELERFLNDDDGRMAVALSAREHLQRNQSDIGRKIIQAYESILGRKQLAPGIEK